MELLRAQRCQVAERVAEVNAIRLLNSTVGTAITAPAGEYRTTHIPALMASTAALVLSILLLIVAQLTASNMLIRSIGHLGEQRCEEVNDLLAQCSRVSLERLLREQLESGALTRDRLERELLPARTEEADDSVEEECEAWSSEEENVELHGRNGNGFSNGVSE